jgi:hypothetical protein
MGQDMGCTNLWYVFAAILILRRISFQLPMLSGRHSITSGSPQFWLKMGPSSETQVQAPLHGLMGSRMALRRSTVLVLVVLNNVQFWSSWFIKTLKNHRLSLIRSCPWMAWNALLFVDVTSLPNEYCFIKSVSLLSLKYLGHLQPQQPAFFLAVP